MVVGFFQFSLFYGVLQVWMVLKYYLTIFGCSFGCFVSLFVKEYIVSIELLEYDFKHAPGEEKWWETLRTVLNSCNDSYERFTKRLEALMSLL